VVLGTIRFSGWDAALQAHHQDEDAQTTMEEFTLYPSTKASKALAKFLKTGKLDSIEVSFHPIGKNPKPIVTSKFRVRVEAFRN
jgi:phage head maturation protease